MAARIIDRGRGPEVLGTRVTVYRIMDFLREGSSTGCIATELHLSEEQVRVALDYIAVPLFLGTSSTLMLANLIWGQWELGSMPIASAYMVILIAIVVVLVFVGRGRLGAGQEQ